MQNKKLRNIVIPTAMLFCLFGLLFVPECDDCYFAYWKFNSFKDFLLVRPITTEVYISGVPANGRYLGNFLGVLQGKLYFTPFGFVRGFLLGTALLAIVFLLSRRFCSAFVKDREAWIFALALVILAPRGIWQQVYSWGAAFVNYLVPFIGILLLLDWLHTRKSFDLKYQIAVGVITFICCLFMETTTLLLVVSATVFLIFSFVRRWETFDAAMPAALGSWLGTFIMVTAPGYMQSDSVRSIGLDKICDNAYVIMTETFVRPAAAAVLISIFLIFLLYRQNCPRWKIWGILLGVVHIACIADTTVDLFQVKNNYTDIRFILGCAVLILWLIVLAEWKNSAARFQIYLLFAAICVTNIPLLFISPIWPRNFFSSYILLALVIAVLYCTAREQGLPSFAWLRVPTIIASVLLVTIYASNFRVYHQRLDLAREQVAAGETELHLLFLPFSGWATNETEGKGDLTYLVYQKEPWDVTFHFYPWHG